MEPYELSLSEAAEQIRVGELSPVELVDSALDRLEAVESRLTAFAHVTADAARASAKRATDDIAAGRYRGPLHGIPLGVKDLYDTAGVPSTSSSRVRAAHVPDTDAAAVAALGQAGMVVIGKTHTHEFAYGGLTPTTGNPWGVDRIPGGSSGGSGAAVAAGVCTVALGTDTAGSIRIPAALCGTVGLKPTYGRTSRIGVTPLSWSLDHVGPLTRHVRDAALVLNVLAGYDQRDLASVDVPVPDYTAELEHGVRGLRIGVPTNYYFDQVTGDVEGGVRAALDVLVSLGAEVREVRIEHVEHTLAAEWGILMPEASAYHQQKLREKADLYTEQTRGLLEVGELILATDYIKALRVRTLMQRAWADVLDDVDVVVTPGMPMGAPKRGAAEVVWDDGPEDVTFALTRLTSPTNLAGLPTLAVPVGFDGEGSPVGMQITGGAFDEATILRVGRAYEAATDAVGRIAPVVEADTAR